MRDYRHTEDFPTFQQQPEHNIRCCYLQYSRKNEQEMSDSHSDTSDDSNEVSDTEQTGSC